MESYVITFILGFLIDKISLFPFVVGLGIGTMINNQNYTKYYYISKEYLNKCKKKINNIQELGDLDFNINGKEEVNTKKNSDNKLIKKVNIN